MSRKFNPSFVLVILLCIASAAQAETTLSPSDIQKKAIIKLFQENQELRIKMADLEKRVYQLEGNKPSSSPIQTSNRVVERSGNSLIPSAKYPFYYTPHILSAVREKPTANAKYIQSFKSTDKVEITEVNCKGKDIGYWGKTSKGWIFISNPTYGTLIDLNGKTLPHDYSYWCSK